MVTDDLHGKFPKGHKHADSDLETSCLISSRVVIDLEGRTVMEVKSTEISPPTLPSHKNNVSQVEHCAAVF